MGPKVLVVEDDAVLRRVIRWNLAKRGLEVREAATREGAILSLASAVAQEYGLVARTEVHGGYVRVRLNRRPEASDRERGEAP